MKRLILLSGMCLIFFSSCIISRHSNMSFVKNRQIDRDAEVVSISVAAFLAKPFVKKALLEDGDSEDEAVLRLITKVKGIRVLTIEDQKDFSKINERLQRYLKRKKYDEWMSVSSNEDHVNINAKMRKDTIKRLLLTISSEDGDGVFIRVKGKFSADDISNTVNSFSEKGLKKKKTEETVTKL